MDEDGPPDDERHSVDPNKRVQTPSAQWNMIPQYQIKEMNAFVMHIYAEKNAALKELDRVITEKNTIIQERNEAIKQRDEAITARDIALRERANAMVARQLHEKFMNESKDRRGIKRNQVHVPGHYTSSEILSKALKKENKLSKDLNVLVSTEDGSLINQINFDETAVPPPVCSCTRVPRQCYKSGNGGWQSSCCTTTLSVFPLPQLPNKRHSRMGGRKMSGNVFRKLLTRLAEEGYDLSVPVDLKNYWAKHGTNRYVTLQ